MFVARVKASKEVFMFNESKGNARAYINRGKSSLSLRSMRLSKLNPIEEPSVYELTQALGYESIQDIQFEGFLHIEGDTNTIYGLRFCSSEGDNKFDFGLDVEMRLDDYESEVGQLQFHKLIKLVQVGDELISEEEQAYKVMKVFDITSFGHPAEVIAKTVMDKYQATLI